MNWNAIQYFSREEMACKCGCGQYCMNMGFMVKLDWLRRNLGFPLPLYNRSNGFGFTGFGLRGKGDYKYRFIHLDDTEGPFRPWPWSY